MQAAGKMLDVREDGRNSRNYEETMPGYWRAAAAADSKKAWRFERIGPVPVKCISQRARKPVAVRPVRHLNKEDTVVGTHRPHPSAIAKGAASTPPG